MDDSSSSLTYTVGFSIAIAAISLFVIFQICRFIFNEIVKYLTESREEEEIELKTERRGRNFSERKLSTATMKRLQEAIEKDTSLSKVNQVEFHIENDKNFDSKRRKTRVRKENIHKIRNCQSMRERKEFDQKLTFLAGYSHRQFNEV